MSTPTQHGFARAGKGLSAWWLALFCVALAGCVTTTDCPSIDGAVQETQVDVLHDDGRSSRVTLWAPQAAGTYPLMLFSHGAYSSPDRYVRLLSSLAAQGFVVAAPLHIDSELIATTPPAEHAVVWATRRADLARLPEVTAQLQDTLDGARIALPYTGMLAAGHSYGAFTAQVLAGAVALDDVDEVVRDPRIKAVIAYSPPGPIPFFIEPDAWDGLRVPQLVVTGTADILPGFIDDWSVHAMAHRQAQAGEQWLWVGQGVDHYFGRLIGRLTNPVPPQDAAFASALSTTAQFARHYSGSASCAPTLAPYANDVAELTRR